MVRISLLLSHVLATICYFTTLLVSSTQAVVILSIGDGVGLTGSSGQVVVSLDNQTDAVKGVQVDICDADNYLTCSECKVASRAAGFLCACNELTDGCCRVQFVSLAANQVHEGTGPIFTLTYEIDESAPGEECRELVPQDVAIADKNGRPIPSADIYLESGEFCFLVQSPLSISPNPVWKSHWFLLPELLVIKGEDTHFLPFVTTLAFQPEGALLPLCPWVINGYYIWDLVFIMPGWIAGEADQNVLVTVTTGGEVVQGSFEIQQIPFF